MSGLEPSRTSFQVRAAQAGDREALDDVLRRHLPRIRRAVALKLGCAPGRNADVDDAVQEALIAAFRGLAQYEPRSDATFMDWLTTIAVHKVHDWRRHGARIKRGGGQVKSFADCRLPCDPAIPSPDPTVSQIVRARELQDAESAAMAALPQPYRDVLVDRDVLGLSYAEIATKLGHDTPHPARALYSRARRKLNEKLLRFVERGRGGETAHG
ncbi:MAG TPA: RNA polymerase sigma factor [Planctomycetota bacterium]|nr:RNA polymerase sigma factor [Planctomycetota bacterium]